MRKIKVTVIRNDQPIEILADVDTLSCINTETINGPLHAAVKREFPEAIFYEEIK